MTEQRLLTCLLVSLTLHTAFLSFVPPLLSRPDSYLKRPLWVDLVELKEVSPPAPDMAQPVKSPLPQEPEDPGSPLRESETTPMPPPPRPLPSADKLLPTMRSLLGLHNAPDKPVYLEPTLDSGQGIHRGPAYDAYLQEIKAAVKGNWKVSGDGELERGTTVIRISIDSEGVLASIDLIQSCGMILHDYEALDALKQSFPLRPPPESLLDEKGKLSIRFSFHYVATPPG